jgi:hypothetical protein
LRRNMMRAILEANEFFKRVREQAGLRVGATKAFHIKGPPLCWRSLYMAILKFPELSWMAADPEGGLQTALRQSLGVV